MEKIRTRNSLESSFLKKQSSHGALDDSYSQVNSSQLSSTCGEATILESLKKIQELKMMYRQTIDQRKALLSDKQNLNYQMVEAKKLMNGLIRATVQHRKPDTKFYISQTNSPQKDKGLLRPGSITKVKPDSASVKDDSDSNTFQINLLENNQSSIRYHKNSGRIGPNKNLEEPKRTHKKIVSNFSAISAKNHEVKTQKRLNKQFGRKSMEIEECQVEVQRLWGDWDQSKKFAKKSYLSPRNSFLRGPELGSLAKFAFSPLNKNDI